jgi:hypothetical protein
MFEYYIDFATFFGFISACFIISLTFICRNALPLGFSLCFLLIDIFLGLACCRLESRLL